MTTFAIGQRVILNPVANFKSDFAFEYLCRLQADGMVGRIYRHTEWKHTPHHWGVDFGVHGRWWFQANELEIAR